MSAKASPHGNDRSANGTLRTIMGTLVQVQDDAKEVITFLESIANTERERDQAVQWEQQRGLIRRHGAFVRRQHEEITGNMASVNEWHSDEKVLAYRSDITKIENSWARINDADVVALLKEDMGSASDRVRLARDLATAYKELRRQIGMFSIPKRMEGFTGEQLGVGDPLDFHDRFKDELEDANDRVAVLRRLAALRVDAIGGLVDVERGVIYHVGGRGRRLLSYGLLILAVILGYGAVYGLHRFELLDLPGFTGANRYSLERLTRGYLLTAVGVMAHIIKKAAELSIIERSRGAEGEPVVSLDRLMLWIHVREYRFTTTIGIAVLAFVMLVSTRQLDGIKALLTGYAVDSFSDLVLKRYSAATSAYAQQVKQALSVPRSPT